MNTGLKKECLNLSDLSELDVAILMFLQEEIPLVPRPYQMLAERFSVEEDFILQRIQFLKEQGFICRIGAILDHQKVGYTVNALTAWNADPKGNETHEQALDRVGKALAEQPSVSHCYARETPNGWDWPVFAMVHAESQTGLEGCLNQLMQAAKSSDMRVLKTVKEWKKTSMKYL